MAERVLFEVHTLKGGAWMIDSTYSDREAAIDVAKSLHGEKRFEGVKVVKDMFDAKTNSGKEIVVFDTSKAPKERPAPASKEAASSAAPTKSDKADVDFRGAAKPKTRSGEVGFAVKTVLLLGALLLGGLALLFAVSFAGNFLQRLL